MLAFIALLWGRGRREGALLFVPLISTVMMLLGFLAPALNFAASYILMGALAWGLASGLRTGGQPRSERSPAG